MKSNLLHDALFFPSLSVGDESFLAYSLQPVALQGLHRVPWMCTSVLLRGNCFEFFRHIGKSSDYDVKMYLLLVACVSVCNFVFQASRHYVIAVTFFVYMPSSGWFHTLMLHQSLWYRSLPRGHGTAVCWLCESVYNIFFFFLTSSIV